VSQGEQLAFYFAPDAISFTLSLSKGVLHHSWEMTFSAISLFSYGLNLNVALCQILFSHCVCFNATSARKWFKRTFFFIFVDGEWLCMVVLMGFHGSSFT
jgi:hypothetical protein